MARAAFMEWIYAGKPRQGPEFIAMQKKTRSAFKLSLRYCRQHEQEIAAEHLAKICQINILINFGLLFVSVISKSSVNADVINGHTGDTAISEMWKNHYQAL